MQHRRQTQLQGKLISREVSAALASHQDVPTSTSNGAGGGKPRVMVIGEPDGALLCLTDQPCPPSLTVGMHMPAI